EPVMLSRCLVLAAALSTGLAPAPRPRPVRKMDGKQLLKDLQGTWVVVSTEHMEGDKGIVSRRRKRVRVARQKWTQVIPGVVDKWTTEIPDYEIRLDSGKTPIRMEVTRSGGPTMR